MGRVDLAMDQTMDVKINMVGAVTEVSSVFGIGQCWLTGKIMPGQVGSPFGGALRST